MTFSAGAVRLIIRALRAREDARANGAAFKDKVLVNCNLL